MYGQKGKSTTKNEFLRKTSQYGNWYQSGILMTLMMLMTFINQVNCQYVVSGVMGLIYSGTRSYFVSDPDTARLTSVHWCKSSSYFVYMSFIFTNGQNFEIGTQESYYTCSSKTGLEDKVFTSACYNEGSPYWNVLSSGFRLVHDDGYVIIGNNPTASCTSVSISNGIYGVSYDTSWAIYGMRFLSKCDYTEDLAGPAGPENSQINLLEQSSQLLRRSHPALYQTYQTAGQFPILCIELQMMQIWSTLTHLPFQMEALLLISRWHTVTLMFSQ